MDQQKPTPTENAPQRRLSAEEIARAEAEAVAAMLRGEAPKRPDGAAPADAPAAPEADARPDFVPYVDDVVEPQPQAAAAAEDEDEPEEEYIPGAMEMRIDALTEKQWKLYQGIGGGLLGIASVAVLMLFNGELSMYGLAIAALLVLALPRYLERAWQHKMPFARRIMLIAMVIGLGVMILITGLRTGFVFTNPK